MRYANHGGMQGHGDPTYTHRLNTQDFDTDRMQEPTPGYSVWAAIGWVAFFIVVVTVVSYLRRNG
jgi:hypothetical protein